MEVSYIRMEANQAAKYFRKIPNNDDNASDHDQGHNEARPATK